MLRGVIFVQASNKTTNNIRMLLNIKGTINSIFDRAMPYTIEKL